jgi:hypothetical protein
MVHLLIRGYALGAEFHLVYVVIAGLDAEDAAVGRHAQKHAALNSAEAAVRCHELLVFLVRRPSGGGICSDLAEIVDPRCF